MDARLPALGVTDDLNSGDYDSIIVVSSNVEQISNDSIRAPLQTYLSMDKSGANGVFVVPTNLKAGKIVFSGNEISERANSANCTYL